MIKKEISFIIPTLNEEVHIGGVLDSIRENLNGRFQYEVIVVDNGSSDRTVAIVQENGATCFLALGCTISSMRNLGALKASANILVFLDADVYLKNEWGSRIRPVMERLNSHHNLITGSLCGISEKNNWIERIWFAPRTFCKVANYMNSGHLIVHRSLFSRVGGFDPAQETGEDYDFCARAKMIGASIENDPELKVVHKGYPKSVKRFFARERWHARGDYKSLKTLVSSRPALVSLANLCMAVTCTIGMVVCSQPWFTFPCAYILFLLGVSLIASIHRYCGKLDSGILGVVFLYMVYITARTLSMVDVAISRLTEKIPTRGTV